MEDFVVLYIVLCAAILIAVSIILHIRKTNKIRNDLINSFGQPPKNTDYDLDSIELYRFYKKINSDNSKHIDDITWNDLDMDLIFKRINVCLTSVGEEYLYSSLYEPQFDKTRLLLREEFISLVKNQPDERLKIQKILFNLGKSPHNGIPNLIFNPEEKLLKFRIAYSIFSIIPLFCVPVILINAAIGAVFLLAALLINTAIYFKTARKIENSLSTIKYFSSLIWCCGNLLKAQSLQSNAYIMQLARFYKIFKPLMKTSSVITQKFLDDSSMLGVLGIIYNYLKIFILSDIRNYNKFITGINKNKEQFHDLYRTIGEIDLSVCVLSFRESLPFYSIPVFNSENTIKFEKIYHPLLSSPTTNDGMIKKNSIITGSNASGKSTFIKALAINSILAQTIFTCAAESFSLKHSLIMTSMAVRDNISSGESYYIAEIKSLKRIIDKIDIVHCFCFIDEILRGTNTVERIAASAAVLNYLNDKSCLCVVASHDIELARMLQDKLDNYHFREQIVDDEIIFDYKIKPGISTTRNAIKLLRYMNFNSLIIENAEKLVESK